MMRLFARFKYLNYSTSNTNFSTFNSHQQKAHNASKIHKSKKSVQKLSSANHQQSVAKLRNVGIIAHIDAGKTTTTEQLLYYSGITDDIGRVDEGTAITDYLLQERERGITIQSAAISLHWDQHRINVLDTPGHIDFTVEVERALRVMDSAIGILDASAGVEAQTKTVWRQANNFDLSRIVFLNKMDKQGANVEESLGSVRKDLGVTPLLTQCNLGIERDFEGVVDLATMSKIPSCKLTSGSSQEAKQLSATDGSDLYDRAIGLRHKLIDELAELDSTMMDAVVGSSSYDDIPFHHIQESIQRVTCTNQAVPVLLGSALKHCGIQPLLDAIVQYLPSPEENNQQFMLGDQLCAFAFKTIHQKERGAVTFLRLYNGSLSSSSTVYNAAQECNDKIGKLYTILADQMMEVKSAHAGDIVGVTGLDKTLTGDTLLFKSSAVQKYDDAGISLPPLSVPDPVFMCSVEAYSTGDQKRLDEALKILVKEDPSLRVKVDTETDQLVLSGMGELHLDVVKDRLLREHKLEVFLGPTLVAYRERIEKCSDIIHHTLERTIGDITHYVTIAVSVDPTSSGSKSVQFVQTGETMWDRLPWFHRKPIKQGAEIALTSGPLLGFPVVDCQVNIHDFKVHRKRTSSAMISAAVTEATHQAINNSGVILCEPLMTLQIYCEEEHLSDILGDLAQRRAVVGTVKYHNDGVTINASSPVATLVGYSTALRKISSGQAHFMMEIEGYHSMSQLETDKVISANR